MGEETEKGKKKEGILRIENSMKQTVRVMVIGAILLAIALNIGKIGNMIGYALGLIMPVVIGAGIAFVMNVPMRGFEKLFRRLSSKTKRGISEKKVTLISMWLTVICLFLVIVLVITKVVPEIVNSLISLYKVIEDAIPFLCVI